MGDVSRSLEGEFRFQESPKKVQEIMFEYACTVLWSAIFRVIDACREQPRESKKGEF